MPSSHSQWIGSFCCIEFNMIIYFHVHVFQFYLQTHFMVFPFLTNFQQVVQTMAATCMRKVLNLPKPYRYTLDRAYYNIQAANEREGFLINHSWLCNPRFFCRTGVEVVLNNVFISYLGKVECIKEDYIAQSWHWHVN